MQIFIAKNDQQLGPFGVAEIEQKLASRDILISDLGWTEGEDDWVPLSSLLLKRLKSGGQIAPVSIAKTPHASTTYQVLNLVRDWGAPITITVSLSSTVVAIADFFSPTLKLLPSLTVIGFLGVILVLILRRILKHKPAASRAGKWLNPGEPFHRAPAFNAAMVVTLVLCFGMLSSSAKAEKNGFLAASFDPIATLQQQMGIISGIDNTVRRVETKVDGVSTKIDGMDGKIDVIKGVVSGDTAMSDPRKELARTGVTWSSASFGEAIRRNDGRVVKLFLAGGMPAHISDGTSSVPPMANLIPLAENERNSLLHILAQAKVPLGTSWRARIAGSSFDVCLPDSCNGIDNSRCANTFPRVALWKKLVELSVKLDQTCIESLGPSLLGYERSNENADVLGVQILRKWGVQNAESYKRSVRLEREMSATPPSRPATAVGMKPIDMDSPRNLN